MKLKQIIINIFMVSALLLLPTATVYAATSCPGSGDPSAKAKVLNGIGDNAGGDCSGDQVNNVFGDVVNILSIITGVTAVIAIIYAGFKYITSGGEANRVGAAKNTLLYAVVGLAVAASAQFLIHFVIFHATHV